VTIAFEAVTVSFPGADGPVPVLAETTLRLDERRVALIGPNGSGKSTLARLVNGLVTATTGQVLVDGLDPDRDGREVRRRVGFAFTDPAASS
jgi:biotin transport system ATP-binding protein